MHSAVMQNKDYIKFADRNTVEVISLSRLDEGVEKNDRKAERYVGKRDGQEIELMIEYPSLTLEEMLSLNTSPAGQFNDTGKIPYTAIVDPHTQEKMMFFSGGQSSGTIMDAVKDCSKKLTEAHGEGISRQDIAALDEAILESRERLDKGDYSKALSEIEKVVKDPQAWPDAMQKKASAARTAVIESAAKALDEIEAMIDDDPAKAKRELGRIAYKLRGTGLEDRADELKESM